jgi:hypothetical protein
LEDFDPIGDSDVTGGGDVSSWYVSPLFKFSLLVPYVPLIIWVIQPYIRMFRWSSSTPLSPSVQADSRKLHAEEGHSNAVRKGGFSGAIALSAQWKTSLDG